MLALAVDMRPIKLQTPPMDLVISELDFVFSFLLLSLVYNSFLFA